MTQPPYGQPPYGQPPLGQPNGGPPPQYGQSQLVVNLRKPFGLLAGQMVTPTVRINGHPATARWGQNFYPTHPGHHQIDCSATYMWSFGFQSMAVDIPPGQSVEVHYTAPLIVFLSGRMGFTEQPYGGMVGFVLLMVIPIALGLISIIAAMLSALS